MTQLSFQWEKSLQLLNRGDSAFRTLEMTWKRLSLLDPQSGEKAFLKNDTTLSLMIILKNTVIGNIYYKY